ncbi:MAG: DUF2341 domain-containing protein [Kiritimatiellae bacterium]|nr:DUF2341 domain-containing protein [Kiritimatiellia bacterium]
MKIEEDRGSRTAAGGVPAHSAVGGPVSARLCPRASTLFSFFIFHFSFFIAAQPSAEGGWLGGYAYRRPVTVSAGLVQGATDLTNFPLLVSFADASLKAAVHGGKVGTLEGYDIAFTAGDGASQLDSDVESYVAVTASNGTLFAWVRMPVLTNAAAHSLYVYYGNSTMTAPAGNAAGVWADYVAVWHLDSITETNLDMTGHQYDGYARGNATYLREGQVGVCYTFDGTGDYIPISNLYYNTAGGIEEIMVESWAKSSSGNNQTIASWDRSETWRLAINDDEGLGQVGWDTSHPGINDMGTSTAYCNGEWHHIVGWFKNGASPDKMLFVDGSVIASGTVGSAIGTTLKRYGYIGCQSEAGSFDPACGGCPMLGQIDEVRISDVAPPEEWIPTSYTNQAAPGDFLTIGAEERRGTVILIK